jgi:RnfABCDGE-type electron transport complex B subunit
MNFILIAVIVLGAIGLIAAVVLFVASKKFAVYEDPRIAQVGELLPGANCGGCGFPGCSGMAEALVKGADAGSLDGLMCPVGGADTMGRVADLLEMAIADTESMVAVVRCNGTCEHRQKIVEYAGLRSCAAMHACGAGETLCGFGCLGCGDCVAACQFGAISINPETGIPEVDEDKCTSCGACVKACPRSIIELRKKGPKGRRVYVSCVNKDKGPAAMKACQVSCIGCGKCEKECPFGAITVDNNLAYIDFNKCRLCRKCEKVCPKHAIVAVNFPAPKPAPSENTEKSENAETNERKEAQA